ncbi:MAG TPA: TIGR03013 family XrtA/PEP-CTERM system glycosyltransferase [Rhizomicrobium sp.]|jgi:sugar transferase (PEP-CTERM system associated)|nr:TIGR03013 family XrtA/PEP-CTERM system glycosyltransferase [Rhizomicrobium sp.]
MRRILGHYIATSWVVFGLLETVLIAVVCGGAFWLVSTDSGFPDAPAMAFAIMLSLVIVGVMHSGGLYQGDAVLNLNRTLWRVAAITIPVFLLAVWTTGELAQHTNIPIYPYRWHWTGALTATWLLSAVLLRVGLREVYRSGWLTRKIVVVGPANQVAELSGLARESSERFRIVAQFDPRTERGAFLIHDLQAQAVLSEASEVVIAINGEPYPWEALIKCRLSGIPVTDYLDFYEREAKRIRVDSLRVDWFALSRGFDSTTTGEIWRCFAGVLFASIGLIAAAPVLILTALAIKLEDGGHVLFRQERVGLGGQNFILYKFRSMRQDAESDGKPAWATERDSRVTKVGRVIRTLRIDELPQFWNVLRGDMSVVGPRPERPYFVHQFSQSIPFYDCRHAVRPGITGWAQVSFRYGASFEDTRRKLSYDLYYVKNRGFLLDLIILLKTIGVCLRGEGAR